MTNSSQSFSDQSAYTAISPRPLGSGVASAFISTFDDEHYAHAISHHNFHPAVPTEYHVGTYHDTDDVHSYLNQRDHIIEGAIREWHGGKVIVRTMDAYEYDDVSSRYEFTVKLEGDPTEANAIAALLEVDPGYLPGDTQLDEQVMADFRAYDRISLPNPEQRNEMTELAFVSHFLGLYLQRFEDTFRRTRTGSESVPVRPNSQVHSLITSAAETFYRKFEGDILAWQQATQYSLAEHAFTIALTGNGNNLMNLRSFDLPNPASFALDEHIITVRLYHNLIEHMPRMSLDETFHIASDGTVSLAE